MGTRGLRGRQSSDPNSRPRESTARPRDLAPPSRGSTASRAVTARELRLGEVLGCSYHLVRRDAFRARLFLPTPDATPQRRAQLRAAAMVEFEVKRDPDRSNIEIARAIRSSVHAVMNAPAAAGACGAGAVATPIAAPTYSAS